MDIRQIMHYSDWTRERLREVLAENPAALEQPIETIAPFRSVHALVAHCIGAEERLVSVRILGGTASIAYEERAATTVEGLFADWDIVRARTRSYVENADSEELTRVIPFHLASMKRHGEMTVEEFLFQIFNHQTFHLGQISMALQHQEIDPPYFDYMFLKARENE